MLTTFLTLCCANPVSLGECTYQRASGPGLASHSGTYGNRSNVCINISAFGFFFAINSVPDDAVYYEYRSFLVEDQLSEYYKATGKQIPYVRFIKNPFASISIYLPTGGYVDFTYGSLPNMCATGFLFTNSNNTMFSFNAKAKQPEYVANGFEDKCIIFTSTKEQHISYVSNFDPDQDKVILYQDLYKPSSLYVNGEESFKLGTSRYPTIIRLLIFSHRNENSMQLNMQSESLPYKQEYQFMLTYNRSKVMCPYIEPCDLWRFISLTTLILWIVIIFAVMIVGCLVTHMIVQRTCPQFISAEKNEEKTPVQFASTNALLEARSEPKGYFAMDPFLRPHSDDE